MPTGRAGSVLGSSPLATRSGPVAEERQLTLHVELAELLHHVASGLAGLEAAFPGFGAGVEMADLLRNGPRRQIAQLVAMAAAVGLGEAQPLALILQGRRHAVALRAGAREQVRGRDLHHRIPIDARIIRRRRRAVRRLHRFEIEKLARLRFHLGRIDQAIAAHPDVVGAFGQIGKDIAALVVGRDDLDVFGRQIARLGDHPYAGLGALRAGDHAADIVGIDAHLRSSGGLGRGGGRGSGAQQRGKTGAQHADAGCSLRPHFSFPHSV